MRVGGVVALVILAACSFKPRAGGDAGPPPIDATDANDASDATDAPPDGPPAACDQALCESILGTCNATTGYCDIDFVGTGRASCRPELSCNIVCDAAYDTCRDGVDCRSADACIITCAGNDSCRNGSVLCPNNGTCDVTCSGNDACGNQG